MTAEIAQVHVTDLPDPLPDAMLVLDVREHEEWDASHIDGAVHIPLMELPGRVGDLTPQRQVLVVCKVGARSAQATAFLRAQRSEAVNLVGGMLAWEAAKRPMSSDGSAPPFVA